MSKLLNFITNVIAWFLKNVNMLVGIIASISKLAAAVLNIFQPSKDDLVDKIEEWSERLQSWIFKGSEVLKKFRSW